MFMLINVNNNTCLWYINPATAKLATSAIINIESAAAPPGDIPNSPLIEEKQNER